MRRNTFPANDNYRVRAYENLLSQIQMELSFKQKGFSNFIVPFLESTSNFKHFEKKMIFITTFFGNYRLWKTWLDHS